MQCIKTAPVASLFLAVAHITVSHDDVLCFLHGCRIDANLDYCWSIISLKGENRMLSSLFYKHGHFCASQPWEVILATLTLSACLASVGIFTTPDRVCGWNYECEKHQVNSKHWDIL